MDDLVNGWKRYVTYWTVGNPTAWLWSMALMLPKTTAATAVLVTNLFRR